MEKGFEYKGILIGNPNSLVGSLYMLLTNDLANRLKKVMGKVVLFLKCLFLARRQSLDVVLIVDEANDFVLKRRAYGLL